MDIFGTQSSKLIHVLNGSNYVCVYSYTVYIINNYAKTIIKNEITIKFQENIMKQNEPKYEKFFIKTLVT